MTLQTILIAIAFYFLMGIVASTLGYFVSFYVQTILKGLQDKRTKAALKEMIDNAPEVEDTRPKKEEK